MSFLEDIFARLGGPQDVRVLRQATGEAGEGGDANAEAWDGETPEPTSGGLDEGLDRMDDAIDRDSGADNVFDGDGSPTERQTVPEMPAYSEWAGAKGGREDGEAVDHAASSSSIVEQSQRYQSLWKRPSGSCARLAARNAGSCG